MYKMSEEGAEGLIWKLGFALFSLQKLGFALMLYRNGIWSLTLGI